MSLDKIAFAGLGRVGKDEAAKAFYDVGYLRYNFGDVIKEYAGSMEYDQLMEVCDFTLQETAIGQNRYERVGHIVEGYLAIHEYDMDVFTENTQHKRVLRPLLEMTGDCFYDMLLERFLHNVPTKCINTRLVRVREAKAWVDMGGVIWEITRPGVAPQTQWEADALEELRATGLITRTIVNDGTVDDLHKKVLEAANGV